MCEGLRTLPAQIIFITKMLCLIQAQRLLLKDGSLAHFTLPPNPTARPTITAGLPAHVSNDTLTIFGVSLQSIFQSIFFYWGLFQSLTTF